MHKSYKHTHTQKYLTPCIHLNLKYEKKKTILYQKICEIYALMCDYERTQYFSLVIIIIMKILRYIVEKIEEPWPYITQKLKPKSEKQQNIKKFNS